MSERKNPMDSLFDENDNDNIVLYNEQNESVELEQIAVIPLNEKVYAILRPVAEIPGVADDEALVFCVDEVDGEEALAIVEDDDIIDAVFEEYYDMLREEGIDVD